VSWRKAGWRDLICAGCA